MRGIFTVVFTLALLSNKRVACIYESVSLTCDNGFIHPIISKQPYVPGSRNAWRHEVNRLEKNIADLQRQLRFGPPSSQCCRPYYYTTPHLYQHPSCSSCTASNCYTPPCITNQCPCPPPPPLVIRPYTGRYCDRLYSTGTRMDGSYTIMVAGSLMQVYCQFQLDGHNWIVFQRRATGAVDFFLDWRTYEQGFGRINGEFWLGLLNLYQLTLSGTCRLRIDIEDFSNNNAFAEYSFFRVGSPVEYYRLSIGFYRGTAGDSLRRHNNMRFSTRDFDNDNWAGRNCAIDNHGAWWYNACQYSNLNGRYVPGNELRDDGINWFHWRYNSLSMRAASMKLRDC